nr:Chain H, Peptide from Nuclear receptor coactivator 2 [Homo sapiens]5Z12_J Chain J, Peptide from Nuclear receptor coactivator 2 [Homo sapiens]
HKILHR